MVVINLLIEKIPDGGFTVTAQDDIGTMLQTSASRRQTAMHKCLNEVRARLGPGADIEFRPQDLTNGEE